MRKYLITFFMLFLPIYSFADIDLIIKKKFTAVEKAKEHQEEFFKCLKAAENMCLYIPNLEDRKHMQALLVATAEMVVIPDPKAKLISVGLTLIGSLSTDIYDKFCEYRMLLVNAEYHLDMFHFYNNLCVKITERIPTNKSIRAFMMAIDCVTLSDKLLLSMVRDSQEENVIKCFSNLSAYFIKEYNFNQKKCFRGCLEKATLFYENLGEMLSECSDEVIIEKINYNTREMMIYLEAAVRIYDESRDRTVETIGPFNIQQN